MNDGGSGKQEKEQSKAVVNVCGHPVRFKVREHPVRLYLPV